MASGEAAGRAGRKAMQQCPRGCSDGGTLAAADEFCQCGESARVEIVDPLKGASMTEPKTHTLDVPGAVLHYDVRSNDSSTEPVLLLIGSPMDARGFGTLAGH